METNVIEIKNKTSKPATTEPEVTSGSDETGTDPWAKLTATFPGYGTDFASMDKNRMAELAEVWDDHLRGQNPRLLAALCLGRMAEYLDSLSRTNRPITLRRLAELTHRTTRWVREVRKLARHVDDECGGEIPVDWLGLGPQKALDLLAGDDDDKGDDGGDDGTQTDMTPGQVRLAFYASYREELEDLDLADATPGEKALVADAMDSLQALIDLGEGKLVPDTDTLTLPGVKRAARAMDIDAVEHAVRRAPVEDRPAHIQDLRADLETRIKELDALEETLRKEAEEDDGGWDGTGCAGGDDTDEASHNDAGDTCAFTEAKNDVGDDTSDTDDDDPVKADRNASDPPSKDAIRRMILSALAARGPHPATAAEIESAVGLGVTRQQIGNHLAVLARAMNGARVVNVRPKTATSNRGALWLHTDHLDEYEANNAVNDADAA